MKFYHLQSEAEIRSLIQFHNRFSDYVVLDTETTDKDPRKATLIDIQISGRAAGEAAMFGAEFAPLLLEAECPLVLQNFKYDFKVLFRHGVDLRQKLVWDTMLLHHLADENADHDLDSIVAEGGGETYKSDFWEKYKTYAEAPLPERLQYACRDVVETGKAYRRITDRLKAQGVPESLWIHVHRLARALLDTEIQGLKVDLDYTIQMGSELKADIVRTGAELRQTGGTHCALIELDQWVKDIEKFKTDKRRALVPKPEFNFASSEQVGKLLYDQLKLPPQFNKKSKNRTADDKALETLEHLHPIIPGIRTLRKYNKMYGAFIEGILDKVDEGRIYPSFNVNGTVTGRISHSEPNCLSLDTEILTARGWLGPEQITEEDKIYCFDDKDQSLVLHSPSRILRLEAKERDIVTVKNEHFDWIMTADHRVIFQNRKTLKFYETPAHCFPKDVRIWHGGYCAGGAGEEIPARISLAVAAQADAEKVAVGYRFKFIKRRKYERLLGILRAIPEARVADKSKGKFYELVVSGVALSRYLTADKRLSWGLLALKSDLRETAIQEVRYWDGSVTGPLRYTSKHKHNVDVLQALAASLGYRGHIMSTIVDGSTYWRIYITPRSYSQTANAEVSIRNEVRAVWCVTVPTGAFVARRGSNTFVTGNCAQMPSKGEWAKIRGIFIPDPGHKIITCDYGQLEVCIAAHYSQDKNLLRIIHEGASKHDITAEGLGIERSKAKTLNFAMQYQCSSKKVAEILGCSQKDAEHAWNKYWETYSGEKRVIDECKAKVDRGEPIVNPFGRRRRFPTMFGNHWEKEAAYRQAYSSLIQGTGGDLTSNAFYRVAEDIQGLGWGKALFTIHDEILAQAKEAHIEPVRTLIQAQMVQAGKDINLSVPLTVDCSEGLERWTK